MLSVDEQTTTMFYWFLKFRTCPSCGKPWSQHKEGAEGVNEAWDHVGDFIAKKVVDEMEARKSQ